MTQKARTDFIKQLEFFNIMFLSTQAISSCLKKSAGLLKMYITFLLLRHSLLLLCSIEQSSVPRAHHSSQHSEAHSVPHGSEQHSGYSSPLPALWFILCNPLASVLTIGTTHTATLCRIDKISLISDKLCSLFLEFQQCQQVGSLMFK